MGDFVVLHDDVVTVLPTAFAGKIILTPNPEGKFVGTGFVEIDGKKVCVQGDEASVTIEVSYNTLTQPKPGTAKITIQSADFVDSVFCSQKPLMVRKKSISLKFTVKDKAFLPPVGTTPKIDDPIGEVSGTGVITSQNQFVTAG